MSRLDADIRKEVEELVDIPPPYFGHKKLCCNIPSVAQFVLVAVLGSFSFGYNFSAFNTSKSFVIADFKWCDVDINQPFNADNSDIDHNNELLDCSKGVLFGSLITSGVFIGLIIGCLLAGRVTRIGRRASLILTNIIFLFGAILSAAAEGFATLFIARLVTGVGVGLATVCVPMYISEFTPDHSRGFYGTLHQLLITMGIFVGTLFGLVLGPQPLNDQLDFKISVFQQIWWRFMLAFPAFVAIFALFGLCTLYKVESPYVLVEKNKPITAKALLAELLNKTDIQHEYDLIERSVCQEKVLSAQSLSLWKAFRFGAYRHVILVASFLAAFQQFGGINILVSNSNRLYASLKLSNDVVTGLTVGMNALNVLMTFPSVFLMDRLGRKTLLVGGCFGQTACLIIAFIANIVDRNHLAVQWLTVACIYGFIMFFAAGYGPVLWVYLHEIFPPEIKKNAAGFASALNGIATIIVVFPSDYIFKDDTRIMLGVCGGACLFTTIIAGIFMKETSGLPIGESPYFIGKQRVMSKYFATTGLDNPAAPVPALASGYYSASQVSASQLPV